MFINADTLAQLREKIAPFDTEDNRTRYRLRQFPRAEAVRNVDTRYRWDLFYASRSSDLLPDGATDAHIDTALRRIVPAL